ncbi:GLE1-like protein-domain-containing protein [Piptocephalis cylindrospora]|uniref:mRNA export factor GLE1 n=1 Tax=Piptocephalis cylindrospora TaxID=1907219 RepID=A0A4P9XY29_9FUNG|nr:GLE1-like protein-domain-containing protein [Piptocephalis cylindrospora]|eukprot:RKP11244.1 GLE1-like protein-domain-containing protein [Piptocephalis cylindrospora]
MDKIAEIDRAVQQGKSKGKVTGIWILHWTSESVLKQVFAEVEANTDAAYPLARVCVGLMQRHQDFQEILLARLTQACQFLIPLYPEAKEDQSLDQRLEAEGWERAPLEPGQDPSAPTKWETMDQYHRRMSSVIALYGCILQTQVSSKPGNPLGMSEAWKWIARLLNLTPRRITATLLMSFLEMTGAALLETYGQQATKLLFFILTDYLPMLPKESVAHATRLKTWLEAWRRTGRVAVSTSRRPQ